MDREETKKIIRIMCDSYPNYKPGNLSETIDVWCMMLSEYSYQQVAMALKSYILADEKGYAPAIGQIVSRIQTITQPQELNEMEAWTLVSRAIRNSTYYSVEEFAKLPKVVQRAVGVPEQLKAWAVDENYNEQVVSSHFIKCYRSEMANEKDFRKMPSDIQMLIQNTFNSSHRAEIETKTSETIKCLSENKKAENDTFKHEIEQDGISEFAKQKIEELRKELQ